jgi:hypothetical protein
VSARFCTEDKFVGILLMRIGEVAEVGDGILHGSIPGYGV